MLPSVVRVFVGAGFYFTLLHELLDRAGVPRKSPAAATSGPKPSAAGSGHGKSQSMSILSAGDIATRTFAASALARTLAIVTLSPISVVKTRLEFA